MKRTRLLLALLMLATVLSACAIPHKKSDFGVEKVAADHSETKDIFTRYRKVRNLAIQLVDPKPLSTVESGPLLAIDSGSFVIAQKLAKKQKTDTSKLDVFDVKSPIVKKYPLWFTAKVRDEARGVIKVQVFERATSLDPWLLVSSPEILLDTVLPSLSHGSHGTIVAVAPDDRTGRSMSPQSAADTYAEALEDPKSSAITKFENDGFIRQMRSTAEANSLLANVTFAQKWVADNVEFTARTDDGGMLVFATLLRTDSYGVKNGVTVTFPEGSPQKAFLARDISSSGKLRYYHQVLLYVPGPGGGKPRALGQYGGVVGADGF
ncbi:MAG: hypothetical protein ABIR57_06070 [Aeromicrobium sp.]